MVPPYRPSGCREYGTQFSAYNANPMAGRVYPEYQPKPDDVFHVVGYTTRDISENAHFRLLDLSARVMEENGKLWRHVGPLVPAMKSGKVWMPSVMR